MPTSRWLIRPVGCGMVELLRPYQCVHFPVELSKFHSDGATSNGLGLRGVEHPAARARRISSSLVFMVVILRYRDLESLTSMLCVFSVSTQARTAPHT